MTVETIVRKTATLPTDVGSPILLTDVTSEYDADEPEVMVTVDNRSMIVKVDALMSALRAVLPEDSQHVLLPD